MSYKLKLEGMIFGRLKAISQQGSDKNGTALWLCSCECGNTLFVRSTSLMSGNSTQCKNCTNKTHGLSSTNLYKVWQGMKTRCTNRKAINFDNYGGRGISYDKQWEHFENFFQDMGYDYKEGLTLERKDNTKGYSKENCKWVTPKEQNENMRCNVYIAYQGDKLSAEVISKMTGLTRATIYHRHRKGWSGERIINTPPIPKTRRIT